MHGLLFKNVPATGAKQCRGFCWTLAATTRPFQILPGLLFKIVPATDPKTGFLVNSLAPTTRPFKGMQRLLLKHCACHGPVQKVRGFLLIMCAHHVFWDCANFRDIYAGACVQSAFSFLKKREESIFHFNEEDSGQPMGNSSTVYSLLCCIIRAISWGHEKLEYQFRANIFRDLLLGNTDREVAYFQKKSRGFLWPLASITIPRPL